MTILRVYQTDPYKGIEDHGTVDFIFDEDDKYAGIEDYGSEPHPWDVLRDDTEYSHVDHNLEIVTLSEMREMKEEMDEEVRKLGKNRDTVERAIRELENLVA